MRDRRIHLAAGGAAAIAAAVAIGAGVVYATSDGGNAPTATVFSSTGAFDDSVRSALQATLQQSDDNPGETALARLAENLGISREELDAALQQTALDIVDQALADGLIDEDRAASLRERIESGEPFGLFGHGFKRAFGGQFEGGIFIGGDRMADRIQDLADDGVIDQATADAIISAIDEADGPVRLQDLVDEGLISQEALDAIREALPLRGPGHHRFHGPGFPFGAPFGGEDEENDDSSGDGESGFEA